MARNRFWLIAAAVVIADQWTKHLVLKHLAMGEARTLLPNLLWLHHLQNPGAAFGRLQGAGFLLVFAAMAAVVFIVSYRARLLRSMAVLPNLLVLGLALPMGGAIGNMIDRIQLRQVVDFIDLGWFPVFNVADSAITVGAAALIVHFLVLSQPEDDGAGEGRRDREEFRPAAGAE